MIALHFISKRHTMSPSEKSPRHQFCILTTFLSPDCVRQRRAAQLKSDLYTSAPHAGNFTPDVSFQATRRSDRTADGVVNVLLQRAPQTGDFKVLLDAAKHLECKSVRGGGGGVSSDFQHSFWPSSWNNVLKGFLLSKRFNRCVKYHFLLAGLSARRAAARCARGEVCGLSRALLILLTMN